jgi:hypothetical protein
MPPKMTRALKYLILHLNTIQQSIEYELLFVPGHSEFLSGLQERRVISRKEIQRRAVSFLQQLEGSLTEYNKGYGLIESPPDHFAILSLARFEDAYYSETFGNCMVLCFGHWKRAMAPPSLLEFFLTSLVRDSIFFISPSLGDRVHLGTKGCLFDFSPQLADARYKVLTAFLCSACRAAIASDGHTAFLAEMDEILKRRWLGLREDPFSPASMCAKLGHDLFITKGTRPTVLEQIRSALGGELVKASLGIVGALVLAGILVWLGLKKP